MKESVFNHKDFEKLVVMMRCCLRDCLDRYQTQKFQLVMENLVTFGILQSRFSFAILEMRVKYVKNINTIVYRLGISNIYNLPTNLPEFVIHLLRMRKELSNIERIQKEIHPPDYTLADILRANTPLNLSDVVQKTNVYTLQHGVTLLLDFINSSRESDSSIVNVVNDWVVFGETIPINYIFMNDLKVVWIDEEQVSYIVDQPQGKNGVLLLARINNVINASRRYKDLQEISTEYVQSSYTPSNQSTSQQSHKLWRLLKQTADKLQVIIRDEYGKIFLKANKKPLNIEVLDKVKNLNHPNIYKIYIVYSKDISVTGCENMKYWPIINEYSQWTSVMVTEYLIPLLNLWMAFVSMKQIKRAHIVIQIFQGCLQGLKCLQSINIVHGDISWGNIMFRTIGLKLEPVIIDCCNSYLGPVTSDFGTSPYAPEEPIRNFHTDIFSMGILFFQYYRCISERKHNLDLEWENNEEYLNLVRKFCRDPNIVLFTKIDGFHSSVVKLIEYMLNDTPEIDHCLNIALNMEQLLP
jgi:hypothetical protein